jgi:DivIVA domain-containing protein
MAAVDIDRQAIEKRDFPIGRRGYDPAAVDAHLRALAAEIEDLQRAARGGGGESSLALTAGTQVQSILQAAETTAQEIEREALQGARNAREDADRDAARTREDAIEQARAHVAAVAQATTILSERVATMDSEVGALVESLRAGAGRLADDLAAVDTNMGELYDAASGAAGAAADREPSPGFSHSEGADLIAEAPSGRDRPSPAVARSSPQPAGAAPSPAPAPAARPTGGNGDLDSARLIALNMALNGESRADADRYLAENFQLADRQKLVDEVYAAIEG